MNLIEIKKDINFRIGDKETFDQLLAITFNGLSAQVAKRAMMEGYMRGFKFDNFLKKDVYAIKYGNGYSLVTSIDYSRKIGAKSGVVGVNKPMYVMNDKKIVSCEITVKKMINGHVGDFTAEVFFEEYTTNKNLWVSKPRTMIAKVAEMHALRKACPEELSQVYVEEEMDKSAQEVVVFDEEEIADDAVVVSTGDDTQGISEAPSPEEIAEIEKKTNESK